MFEKFGAVVATIPFRFLDYGGWVGVIEVRSALCDIF